MKKIYRTATFLILLLGLSACGNSWLDTKPKDSVPSDEIFDTYKSASVALTGMYDGLQGSSSRNSYYAARMFYYGDVRGQDMQARTNNMRSSSCYEMVYIVDNAPNMWDIPYNVIRRANRIIEAVDNNVISDATPAQYNKLKSEALVVRALVHFDLVRLYGQPYTKNNGESLGVPIVLTPSEHTSKPKRSSVAEVYTQVLKDLDDALDIGGLVDSKFYGYVNTWFAKGLKARVLLYKGDYPGALPIAEDVIKNSPYPLWTNTEYVEGWNTSDKGRKEMLFELINYNNSDWADREGIAYLLNELGYADLICTKSFLDIMESDPNDVRLGVLVAPQKDKDLIKEFGDNKVFVNKLPTIPGTNEMRTNSLPIMRISELYLIAAESAAHIGNSTKAAQYLNDIVLRANPNATPIAAKDATVERILLEKRKELVGEGQSFFDAMRTNQTIIRYNDASDIGFHMPLRAESMKFDWDYFRTILPIPFGEMNTNTNLKGQQNPGY